MDASDGMDIFAIREARGHPWIISTSRHISQDAVSLLNQRWDAGGQTLWGRSAVIGGDPYVMTVHLPQGFKLQSAEVNGEKVQMRNQIETATARIVPTTTQAVEWKMTFAK